MELEKKVKFSIVTVCLNAQVTICRTLESVYNQSFQDYEHIIVDGCSTDSTLQIVNQFKRNYTEERFKIYSEKDEGIYDAMNKGIELASGEFICFMNSGDMFYDKSVLEKVAEIIDNNEKCDLYYGDAVRFFPNETEHEQLKHFVPWKKDTFSLCSGMTLMPCHQAIFSNKKCFDGNLFDLNYKLRAELKWFINCCLKDIKMHGLNLMVCRYLSGGTSDQIKNVIISDQEKKRLFLECDLASENELKRVESTSNDRSKYIILILNKWLALSQAGKKCSSYFGRYGYRNIAIYGYGMLGNRLFAELADTNVSVKYFIDREKKYAASGVEVYSPEGNLEEVDVVIATPVMHLEMIRDTLRQKVQCPIISLDEVLDKLWDIDDV